MPKRGFGKTNSPYTYRGSCQALSAQPKREVRRAQKKVIPFSGITQVLQHTESFSSHVLGKCKPFTLGCLLPSVPFPMYLAFSLVFIGCPLLSVRHHLIKPHVAYLDN